MCGQHQSRWSTVKEWRMGRDRRPGWGWEVWLAVWAGAVISLIAILLYCLILDIDTPDIKPRAALENSAAAIVYIAHTGNIVASFVLAFALLQEEYSVMLVWGLWTVLYTVLVLILIPLSCFTMLKHIPGRIILHIICILIAVFAFITILRIYRRKDRYDWEPRSAKAGGNKRDDINGFNNKASGETGVL